MRLCIYEDSGNAWLEPLALTRPGFALWCGAERLFERQRRQFAPHEVGYWVRPLLIELWKLEQPDEPVNDADWLHEGTTIWLNGRWLPAAGVTLDPLVPHVGVIGEQIAYAVLPAGAVPSTRTLDAWLEDWKQQLPNRPVGGAMINFLWDLVDRNGEALTCDAAWFQARHPAQTLPSQVAVLGPQEQLIVAQGAVVEPFVFADTRGGPVMIDQGAHVHAFSRLEGPCYVGKESWIVAAKLRRDSTIGPGCRIGGEVEASIVQGQSNKYHDGFLGHSYVGAWVNLAAATQTSDLRNDYDVVRVTVNGQRIVTGRAKIGSYIGDHAKTGLGALLNTGSTIGAFANVLPSGDLAPQVIPSFCLLNHGQLQEQWDLRKLFNTAARVMQRRGQRLTDVHLDFFYGLFDATSALRHKAVRDLESRRIRRSV
jgi:UDP-N-acetylglucosamine diphosphorylase / glucose-1-phosphate thymidylyltransferase / UDP-N-acetylgalactosamine diphosphorylase / glucosamine-1-phosphate N-acetyltransferase / galactosamine-1-phosphate N-acetyltransferase